MLIRIDKKEKDLFEKECAMLTLETSFYSIETNDNMIQVEVLDRGKEISLLDAFSIGRLTGMGKLYSNIK